MSAGGTSYVAPGEIRPCLTLAPVPTTNMEEKTFVQFTLKVRAGSASSAPTYKMKIAQFASGSPTEWIEVLETLEEIFLENGLTLAANCENVIRTILCGDSLTAYKSHVHRRRENPVDPGHPLPLCVDIVDSDLTAVLRVCFLTGLLLCKRFG